MLEIKELPSISIKRFTLSRDGKELFSLSKKIMRVHGLSPGKQETTLDVAQIEKDERGQLKMDLLRYLLGAERSPRSLNHWMKIRGLPPLYCEELKAWAVKENYFSETRYGAILVGRFFQKGNIPWWQVKQKLKAQGISEKVMASFDYDQSAALKNYLRRNKHFSALPLDEKKKKLIGRGFPHDLIDHVLSDVEVSQK